MHFIDSAERGRIGDIGSASEACWCDEHPGKVPLHEIHSHVPDRIRLAQAELTLRRQPDPVKQIDQAQDLFLGHLGLALAACSAAFETIVPAKQAKTQTAIYSK